MRLIHLSDLHLGKRLNEFSLIEDQKYILEQILEITDQEKPDGVVIAGDIFDKSMPGEEAILLWDGFVNQLAQRKLQVFVISGNHDSAVRTAQFRRLLEVSGIHVAPVYKGNVEHITVRDLYGEVHFYLLPFIKPVHVREYYPQEEIASYEDACRVAVEHMEIDDKERNVLVAHQFVTGAQRSESEEITVGGVDNVDAAVFSGFDYVALGHIHKPQHIGRETLRYCGTPLKYSLSEKDHTKSVVIVDLLEKGNVAVRERELQPLREVKEIRGSFWDLIPLPESRDYVHVVLTDEEETVNAMGRLRGVFPNMIRLSYDNTRTRQHRNISGPDEPEEKSPMELFEELYEKQNNQTMSQVQRDFAQQLFQEIWGA